MAIVVGVVTLEEHQAIRRAGYDLASVVEVVVTMAGKGANILPAGEHVVGVWVDCDLVQLLDLKEEN